MVEACCLDLSDYWHSDELGADPLTFTADVSASLSGPEWLSRRRSAAWERFANSSLPSEDEDLWKYSGINNLDLDLFAPSSPGLASDFTNRRTPRPGPGGSFGHR